MALSREEFIGIAADAILKHADPRESGKGPAPVWASELAEVALEAVGAWTTFTRDLKQVEYDAHRASCQTCGDGGMSFVRPMPCARAVALKAELSAMRRHAREAK